jgi:serine/threonine-protein kinase
VSFTVGQTIGDYQVIEILGAGGMGTVYKVRHLISDRLEAMKLVLPELTENPDLADRFMREIKVQARLSHPNIASLHNALRIGNQLLMVIELIEGSTLHAILRRSPMEPLRAIDIAIQILDALEYAHSQGVIHRDIKPANIMITTEGKLKLMDFGIAHSIGEERHLTQTGAAVGSIYYMSPEQVQGIPVDARADLYSVGILLYEMATGIRPITGDTSYAVMNAHLHAIPRAPSEVNPRIPESLSLAILLAMEKNREHRFQTARAFSESLKAVRSRLAGSGSPWASAPHRADLQPTELATPVQSSQSKPGLGFVTPAATVTPSPSAGTPVSGTAQPATVRFDPERLEKLTRELASFVGPMAKVLVNRAAKKAQTWKQLYDALAPEVPEGAERKQFLSKRP